MNVIAYTLEPMTQALIDYINTNNFNAPKLVLANSSNTVLATFTFAAADFQTSSFGVVKWVGTALSSSPGTVAGTVTKFHFGGGGFGSGVARIEGTVGTSGADVNLPSNVLSSDVMLESFELHMLADGTLHVDFFPVFF